MKEYPDIFIRGIANADFITDEGLVDSGLFHFYGIAPRAEDNLIELSINWNDDDGVINFTMQQTKDSGEVQFRAGIALVARDLISKLNSMPQITGSEVLSYERKPLDDNPYHGNLLLIAGLSKRTSRLIGGWLALNSEYVRAA